MKRSLTAAVAVLVLAVAAMGATATTSTARSSALPTQGWYEGIDHHHRTITFYYDGKNYMSHFTVGHKLIGGAHVSGHEAAWHRTCHGGYCSSGMWVTDTQVHGTWDPGSTDRHVPYHAHWRHY